MRKLMLLTLLLLVFGLNSSVLAQELPAPFCGSLSEEDCAIIQLASTAQMALSSATMTMDGTMAIPSIEGSPALSLQITGSGAFSADMGALQGLSGLMTGAEIPTGAELVSLISGALRAFNGDLDIKLVLPPELLEGAPSTMTDVINLQLRMVEGFGYINMDPLAPMMGESGAAFSGWGGLDLAGLIEQVGAEQLEVFDMAFSSAAIGNQMEMVQQFSDPAGLGQYITVTRQEDRDGAAVFETAIDFSALMADPAYNDAMRAQMEAQMQAQGMTLTEEEMQMSLDISMAMFKDSTFLVTQVIEPTTGYTLATDLSMEFDLANMMTAAGGEASSEPLPFVFSFSVGMTDHNTDIEITAPEGANVMPLEQLMPMMDMGGST